MTRAVALALILSAPAHAGDTAPGAHLWPLEPEWRVTIFEITCVDLKDCCGVHRDCGDWHTPDPAPVPLPPTLPLLTAAIAALIWKGSSRA